MIKKILWTFILVFSFLSYNNAQSCMGFYKSPRCAVKDAEDFKQYGQAKSAAVAVGKKYKCEAVLYGQKDYIVNVCAEAGFKNVHFKIVDKTNNEVIYDNEEDNYNNAIAFSIEKTSNVEIEVEVVTDDKDLEKDPQLYRACIGVQILWRKIPKMGFEKT